MVTDKSGKIFDDRRNEERRKQNKKVEVDNRKKTRRKIDKEKELKK